MLGLVGKKRGMSRVFTDDGKSIPVTVVEIFKSKIVQRKTQDKDGYYAIQVAYGSKKRVSKSLLKKFNQKGSKGGYLTEFTLSEKEYADLKQVKELTLNSLEKPEKVDVSGISKGKGFAGVVKRHNFKTQDATHGNSLSHRAPGSIGQCQFPGRVFKGKKMSGQMGNKLSTVQNLVIEKSLDDENVLLIKGAVPGAIGTVLKILPSIKSNSVDNSFKLKNIDNEETQKPAEVKVPTETQTPADNVSKGANSGN